MAIKRKWFRLIMVTASVFVFSFCISLGMTMVNNGFTPDFLLVWLRNWLVAFCFAFPASWFLQPIIAHWVHKIKFSD
ncbi:DUF2798 domain-containing protein [Lonepinella koalarum]|uniref:DUF2798 domain-containing protein n=1 Tax=Lonepinella koalarum TaxID=53417 RepID=UPI003F6E2255